MTYEQAQRLIAATGKNSFYLELLSRCGELEPDYIRIMYSLPDGDRDKLEQYISLCEEMEHRRTLLAYALGTQDGIKNRTAQFVVD